jgi:hypothetical protein
MNHLRYYKRQSAIFVTPALARNIPEKARIVIDPQVNSALYESESELS